jgi:hypothetical protein
VLLHASAVPCSWRCSNPALLGLKLLPTSVSESASGDPPCLRPSLVDAPTSKEHGSRIETAGVLGHPMSW